MCLTSRWVRGGFPWAGRTVLCICAVRGTNPAACSAQLWVKLCGVRGYMVYSAGAVCILLVGSEAGRWVENVQLKIGSRAVLLTGKGAGFAS